MVVLIRRNFSIFYTMMQNIRTVVSVAYRVERSKKGKAIPLQAWTGPEGSKRLRLPDFKTIGT
jgi:hypothetical protein